ncbi:hypothetical protein BDR26DRAFT_879600 [Obelidium mucronatum]|nr:hypothetical protein BDR26DRAFT_879600 [Obelidium mucronatum]
MLTGTTYRTINDGDSTNFHAGGHITLGGSCDVGNFHWSPRDPLFFLHHAYVDKVFWRWQNLCPQYRYSYEGNLADGFNADNPEGGSSRCCQSLHSSRLVVQFDSRGQCRRQRAKLQSIRQGYFRPEASSSSSNSDYFRGNTIPNSGHESRYLVKRCPRPAHFQGIFCRFGNAFPQPKAQKRRQDNQEETSISLSLVQTFFDYTSNTTTVTVDCTHIDSGRLDTYTIPEGYELHKAMCNRIVVTPIDYEHVCDLKKPKDWDAAKPMALFSNSLCNLEQELLEPVVYSSDPNAPVCPRFLNDAEIARFHVNPCVSKRNARLVSKTCRLLKQ